MIRPDTHLIRAAQSVLTLGLPSLIVLALCAAAFGHWWVR